jgi:hypothetical protein
MGRAWIKYKSMARLRELGIRRSSHLLFLVLLLGKLIHQLPFTSLNVFPISSATKFLRRI